MKKIILSIFSVLALSSAYADRISSTQALQNVITHFNTQRHAARTINKVKAYTLVKESAAYYVFAGSAGNGYIIAAADDDMVSPVLGYSDSGTFDAYNMPENMKWWLSQYDEEVAALSCQSGETVISMKTEADVVPSLTAKKAERIDVDPLLTAKWGQKAPYNDLCPTINGSRSLVGCVAVAMGQLMYYYNWPDSGTGSHSYYAYNTDQGILSVDFSQSHYDWPHMIDSCSTDSPAETCTAVAKLLSDVGISIDMNYDSGGSGSNLDDIPNAVSSYFKYSREAVCLSRLYYTTEEWEEMAYQSIVRHEPLMYSGRSGMTGHAFVCDGYSNGYFHFNWGWYGHSNGYFLLSALKPMGSKERRNYTIEQQMVVNARPDKDGSSKYVAYMTMQQNEDFNIIYDAESQRYAIGTVMKNATSNAISAAPALEFVDSTGVSTFKRETDPQTLSKDGKMTNVSFSSDVFPKSEGTYKVYPAYYDGNNDTYRRLHVCASYSGFVYAMISNGVITLTQSEDEQALTGSIVKEDQYNSGEMYSITATITNNGVTSRSGDVNIGFFDSYDGVITAAEELLSVKPGESVTITGNVYAPSNTGTYKLGVKFAQGDYIVVYPDINVVSPISELAVTLTEAPVITVDEDNNLTLTGNVSVTSGIMDECLMNINDKETGGFVSSKSYEQYIQAGESMPIVLKASVPSLQPETEYEIDLLAGYDYDYIAIMYGDTKRFSFTTPKKSSSAIVIVQKENTTTKASYYNLQGQQVGRPVNGQLYIVKGRKTVFR